jgi:hypothetical protein
VSPHSIAGLCGPSTRLNGARYPPNVDTSNGSLGADAHSERGPLAELVST